MNQLAYELQIVTIDFRAISSIVQTFLCEIAISEAEFVGKHLE